VGLLQKSNDSFENPSYRLIFGVIVCQYHKMRISEFCSKPTCGVKKKGGATFIQEGLIVLKSCNIFNYSIILINIKPKL
jgi:hypothetical protein